MKSPKKQLVRMRSLKRWRIQRLFWAALIVVLGVAVARFLPAPIPSSSVKVDYSGSSLMSSSDVDLLLPSGWTSLNARLSQGAIPLGSTENPKVGEVVFFGPPSDLQPDVFYLTGVWRVDPDGLRHTGLDPGVMFVRFSGGTVLLLASADSLLENLSVFVDGAYVDAGHAGKDVEFVKGVPVALVKGKSWLEVVSNVSAGQHLFAFSTRSDGLKLHEVRFG